ncbi:TPA: hypothetical protein DIV48_02470 [Candidatus Kaiserbacteria bacterium]|nr:MAG: hypothetical protein UY93_C0002G0139 [Parcubacteria group bacterium GW2011_GWA1_56_13]KKW46808.1 MAG: hypothetical protein UY97_C0003G0082 [Parcubacteria group bacterium GW2011_GWB1_57_6]HCR52492.1 hypothetical protein [Candidatus Kaiserbacteria bacterium]
MKEPRKPLKHHLHDYFFPHERNQYRPHLFSSASIAALVVAVVMFESAYLVQTKFVFFNTDFLASVLPATLAALTNQDRAMNNLSGVTEDPLLDQAAQAAALDMAAKGYFAHVSPDGKTPWYWLEQVGYTYSYAGQNLAVNFTDSENVESAWMASAPHRANIMKPQYTHIGFGTANGMYEGRMTTFVVEFFATPAAAAEKTALATPAVPAKTALATPAPKAPTSTSPVKVLGSQVDQPGAAASAPASASPNWLARLLASPLNTLIAIFSILFSVIAAAGIIAILMRMKVPHPSVLVGSALVLALIGISTLFNFELAGPVQLNAQPASVEAALP